MWATVQLYFSFCCFRACAVVNRAVWCGYNFWIVNYFACLWSNFSFSPEKHSYHCEFHHCNWHALMGWLFQCSLSFACEFSTGHVSVHPALPSQSSLGLEWYQKAFGRVPPQMTALGCQRLCLSLSCPNVRFNNSLLSRSNAGTLNLADSPPTLFFSPPISSHLNWGTLPWATTASEAAWIPSLI